MFAGVVLAKNITRASTVKIGEWLGSSCMQLGSATILTGRSERTKIQDAPDKLNAPNISDGRLNTDGNTHAYSFTNQHFTDTTVDMNKRDME